MKTLSNKTQRQVRHKRVRAKISGTKERPRLAVFKSNRYISAQLIDDEANKVLAHVSTRGGKAAGKGAKSGKLSVAAGLIGENIAKLAAEKNITECVFDRNGYKYHGKVKALADGARKGGLKF